MVSNIATTSPVAPCNRRASSSTPFPESIPEAATRSTCPMKSSTQVNGAFSSRSELTETSTHCPSDNSWDAPSMSAPSLRWTTGDTGLKYRASRALFCHALLSRYVLDWFCSLLDLLGGETISPPESPPRASVCPPRAALSPQGDASGGARMGERVAPSGPWSSTGSTRT